MFKKYIISLAILAIAFGLSPIQAKDWSVLKVGLSDNMSRDCGIETDGCFWDDGRIYVKAGLSAERIKFVLVHELAHFILSGATLNDYYDAYPLFRRFEVPLPAMKEWGAMRFINWLEGGKVEKSERELFAKCLR